MRSVRRRLIFAGVIALGIILLTWLVYGESSPVADYFPESIALRNIWMMLNVVPYIASAVLSGSHGGGPDFLFVILQFVQWFVIAFIVLTLLSVVFRERSHLGVLWVLVACVFPVHAFQSGPEKKFSARTVGVQIPVGIDESLWAQKIPKDNPLSKEKIALGRALYFDKRLSIDGTVSCATCHDPALAFTDANVVAVGGRDTRGTRNAPTLLNTVFNQIFFWDGRAHSLEEQVKHPLLSSFEMGMTSEKELVSRLASIPEYQSQFKRVFKTDGLTIATIAKAIAAYERTLLSGNSPFDRFISGQRAAISDAQKRGWQLFKGKARCSECHTYSPQNQFFTDFQFHNTGVGAGDAILDQLAKSFKNLPERTSLAHAAGFSELGRFAVSLQPADTGAFKTPTLRDLELTAPYMHDGSLKTLIDVVQFYNRGSNANRYLDKRIHPLQLNDAEVNELVQFLRALTSDDVLRQCQTTTPQSRVAVSF